MTTNYNLPIIYVYGCVFLLLASLVVAQPSEPPPQYGFNTRFSPSMAIIIIVLISAFFFMGFFSIYIRQCTGDNSRRGGSARGGFGGRSRRQQRGLDRAVIETFPTFEYSVVKGLKLGKGTLECAVCLSEFQDDENLRLLPKCSHVFHTECVDEWLMAHTTCPVCRANLIPGSDGSDAIGADAMADLEDNVSGSEDHPDEVAITIDEDGNQDAQPEVIDRNQIPINRPPRSGSSRRPMRWLSGKFPRSHSTGHSLVQPGENVDRFTLRLPEHIRKDLIQAKLDRTVSCVERGEISDGSGRRGRDKIGEESSSGRSIGRSDARAKSDRWGFAKAAPAFFSRTFSLRSPKGTSVENAATTPRNILQSVNCLGGGTENDEQSAKRNLTPVFTVSPQQAG